MIPSPSTSALDNRRFRPEIQGLRAIAVLAVLLFHVWPAAVPGGFVGVDIFFVISGFLITKHLVDERVHKGRIDFADFYARRIRRLFPAATLILTAITIGTVLFLPETIWQETAWHVLASAFYGENWFLAWQATDYLAAENTPGPTQHYWSLSIEEQFYFVWPILIMVAGYVATRIRTSVRWTIFAALTLIFGASLLASIVITETNPAQAYFVSHTRVWELALGGLLAIARLRVPEALRAPLGWVGFVMILAACLHYNKLTPFPSYTALLPTVGTAMMILSEESSGRKWGLYPLLTPKPVQYLGDISYSLYLWHWPIIIFFTARNGLEADLMNGIGLIAVAVVLSHFTKRFIEDPYRKPKPRSDGRDPLLTPTGFLGWTLLVSVIGAGVVYISGNAGGGVVDERPLEMADYPGAEAAFSSIAVAPGLPVRPAMTQVKRDLPKSYNSSSGRCHMGYTDDTVTPKLCIYGDETSDRLLYLVGDSHALNWALAFDAFGKKEDYKVKVYTRSACPILKVLIRARGSDYETCLSWGDAVIENIMSDRPDYVFFGQTMDVALASDEISMPDALDLTWSSAIEAGVQVAAIADTSRFFGETPSDCYARTASNAACATPLSEVLRPDPLVDWAQAAGLPLLDFNDGVCPDGICVPVVGNVVVWRDGHHLTATFSRSFGPELARRLEGIL